MARPQAGPGEAIDRSLVVAAGVATEFGFFNRLQRHYAHNYEYPEQGRFIERNRDYNAQQALKLFGSLAVINGLVVPEGANLGGGIHHKMTYRSYSEYGRPFRAQPVVVASHHADSESGSVEVGLGWQLMVSSFHPVEYEWGKRMWVSDRSSDIQLATVALTLFDQWDAEFDSVGLEARQYISPNNEPLETPSRRLPATDIPVGAQQDFLQAFHDAAWESVSEPA